MEIIQLKSLKPRTTLTTLGALALILTTGASKPPTGPSDIPLLVTIETLGNVAGDGSGEYRNANNGVIAVFTGAQGRFRFDTGTRRKSNVVIPGFLGQGNYRVQFLISAAQQDPNVNTNPDPHWHDLHLENLALNTPTPVGLQFIVTTSPSDTGSWYVDFGDYPLATSQNSFPCGGATPAVVTRLDANTWTFEAFNVPDSDLDNDHCLYHGFIDGYKGLVGFSFKMTLRRM